MPRFRNRNSGQVVTVEDDPSYLSGLARWERIEEGPRAPETYQAAEPEPTEYTDTPNLGLDPELGPPVPFSDRTAEPDAGPALPAADADRAEWVAYAKAHGKTDAELKGKKVETIRGWFVADDE